MALQYEATDEERKRIRLDELDALDEKRLAAQQNLELYQARMSRAYEKSTRIRQFVRGELVLVLRRPILGRHVGPKFQPKWEGPYVIEKVFQGGAYQLVNHSGERIMPPINDRYLKKILCLKYTAAFGGCPLKQPPLV